jgi:uncharacterized surface protein with fasciclin (FAS1) repeats
MVATAVFSHVSEYSIPAEATASISAPVFQSNGVIHVIETVLMPN